MDLKKFEEIIHECKALKNYNQLKKTHEKMKKQYEELAGIKVDNLGKTMNLGSIHEEVKKLRKEISYGKTFLGLEGNLDEIPPKTIVKVLNNIAGWLEKKSWREEKYTPATAPRLLHLAIGQIQKKYKLGPHRQI